VESIMAGSHFGEETVMLGTKRTSTMQAATDAIVYEIAKDQMKEILIRRGDLLSMLNEDIAVSASKITTKKKSAARKRNAPAKKDKPRSKIQKAVQTLFNFI
jgi:CRP-like cAMP-binding protein